MSAAPDDLAGLKAVLQSCADGGGGIAAHVHAHWERTALDAIDSLQRQLSEARALFEECQIARDEAGFLGSVPECIKHFADATADAERQLAEARADADRLMEGWSEAFRLTIFHQERAETTERQLSEARAAKFGLEQMATIAAFNKDEAVKQHARAEDLTRQLSASRAEGEGLRAALMDPIEAVLSAKENLSLREVETATGVDHACLHRFLNGKPIESPALLALLKWAALSPPSRA